LPRVASQSVCPFFPFSAILPIPLQWRIRRQRSWCCYGMRRRSNAIDFFGTEQSQAIEPQRPHRTHSGSSSPIHVWCVGLKWAGWLGLGVGQWSGGAHPRRRSPCTPPPSAGLSVSLYGEKRKWFQVWGPFWRQARPNKTAGKRMDVASFRHFWAHTPFLMICSSVIFVVKLYKKKKYQIDSDL
jgi:hypothetical protein